MGKLKKKIKSEICFRNCDKHESLDVVLRFFFVRFHHSHKPKIEDIADAPEGDSIRRGSTCKFRSLKLFRKLRHKIYIKWLFSEFLIYQLLIADLREESPWASRFDFVPSSRHRIIFTLLPAYAFTMSINPSRKMEKFALMGNLIVVIRSILSLRKRPINILIVALLTVWW